MSSVIQWMCEETSILDVKVSSLKVLTYEYDGIKVLHFSAEKYGGVDKLIADVNVTVLARTGFNVTFEQKLIDTCYEDLEYEPYDASDEGEEVDDRVFVTDDNHAA